MELQEFFFGPAPIVWLQDFTEALGPTPFRILSLLGDTWGLLLVLGLAFWLWGRESLHALIPLIVIEAGTYLVISHLVGIPRPNDPAVVTYENLSISAFPSGHTYLTTVLWGFLYNERRVTFRLATSAVVAVVLGRLALGVHNVGDVLGGIVLGALLASLYASGWPWLRRTLLGRSLRSYTILAGAVVLVTIVSMPFFGGNPRWFGAAGIVLAAAVVLPLEHARIRFEADEGRAPPAVRVLVGMAGILLALFLRRTLPGPDALLATLTMAGATVWIFLVAPTLAERLTTARRAADLQPDRF